MASQKSPNSMSASALAQLCRSFDYAPWAVIASSGETHIVRYANPEFCRLIGKAQGEVVGRPFAEIAPQTGHCLAPLDRVFRTGEAASYTADSHAPFPLIFAYTLWPVMTEGRTAGVMIKVNETGPLQETRQAISQALLLGALHQHELVEAADSANAQLEKEISESRQLELDAKTLTREVSHRVKNNLQVVVALIANEIKRTPAPWVDGYVALQDHLVAIAHLYDLISRSSGQTIALDAYLADIAKSLSASLLGEASGVRITLEAEALEIDPERAVPFGLVVNELVTNAVKHAFPGGSGLVRLAVNSVGDAMELTVTDDGIGTQAYEEAKRPGKHGSDYVAIFVRQLHGDIVKSETPGGGTTVRIRIPLRLGPAAFGRG